MIEDLDEIADPARLAVRLADLLLIGPVRGQTVIGMRMHFLIADLDLDPHPLRMNHGGVERAVAVALGRGDIILEPPRHHRPFAVDQPQRAVTLIGIGHDHAERHDIGKLLEADVALGHLAPDRIGMLLPPRDIGTDTVAAEMERYARADPGNLVAAALLQLGKAAGDRFVCLGLQHLEGERLHLLHEFVHAHPLGERRIDFHRPRGRCGGASPRWGCGAACAYCAAGRPA